MMMIRPSFIQVTGLPSFATLFALLNFLGHLLPQKSRLSPFQTLMIVFLKLRSNLPTQHIAYLLNMHRTTLKCIDNGRSPVFLSDARFKRLLKSKSSPKDVKEQNLTLSGRQF